MMFDHPDEIGSATTATDCAGNDVQERLYLPFGEFSSGAGSAGMHQEFAQLPDYDPETDQYNTANRHYSPSGRWLSPDPKNAGADPSDPQTWNMYAYAYVRNNPTMLTDSNGEDWATAWQDLKAALGTIYFRVSLGVGFGGKGTVFGVKGEAELAAKVNVRFSGTEGKVSLTKSTEAAITAGIKGGKVGIGGSIENTVASGNIETHEVGGPEPPHAEVTKGIGTETIGTDPTSDEVGLGGEGGEFALGGGEIGLTKEGWSLLGSAILEITDQFTLPAPPAPPAPPKPNCTPTDTTNCGVPGMGPGLNLVSGYHN
jgi:RHS repeat-associated protein